MAFVVSPSINSGQACRTMNALTGFPPFSFPRSERKGKSLRAVIAGEVKQSIILDRFGRIIHHQIPGIAEEQLGHFPSLVIQ